MRSSVLVLAASAALAFAPCSHAFGATTSASAPAVPRVVPVNLGQTLHPTPTAVAFVKKYPVKVDLGNRNTVVSAFVPRVVPVSLQKR